MITDLAQDFEAYLDGKPTALACLMYFVVALVFMAMVAIMAGVVAYLFWQKATNPDVSVVGVSVGFVLSGIPALVLAVRACVRRIRN